MKAFSMPKHYSMNVATFRRGFTGSQILMALGGAILAILVIMYSVRGVSQNSGERELELPMVCASCYHAFVLTHDEMIEMVNQAPPGQGRHHPMGICPECGKLAVYRAHFCPECHTPIPPEYAQVDGEPVEVKCPKCGWTAGKNDDNESNN